MAQFFSRRLKKLLAKIRKFLPEKYKNCPIVGGETKVGPKVAGTYYVNKKILPAQILVNNKTKFTLCSTEISEVTNF